MKHVATATFWARYDALPKRIRNPADENFKLLKQNTEHPSLHFEDVGKGLGSARAGMHFHALAISMCMRSDQKNLQKVTFIS